MNILITGSRSAKTFKLLKFFTGSNIFLADYGDAPVGSAAYHFISLGEKNTDVIAHNLLNKCLDHTIDLFIPLHPFEIEAVAKAILLFNEFGIEVLLPQLSILSTFLHDELKPTGDLIVIKNEALYPEAGAKVFPGLSGVFYTNENGDPYKLFTID